MKKKETVLAWQRRWTDTTQGPPFHWIRTGEHQASLAKEGGVWRALPWDWPPVVTTAQVLRLSLLPTSGLTSPRVVPTVESPLGESRPLLLALQPGPVFLLPQAPRRVRSRTSQKAPQVAGALRIHGARAPPMRADSSRTRPMTPPATGSSRLQVQCQSYQRPLWTRPGCQAAPVETGPA